MSLVEQIEALIVSRGLPAGARLPSERALSAELGVSRSRLREAMQQLISRGVVVSRQGGGTFVVDRSASLAVEGALKTLEPLVRSESGYWRDVMEIRRSLDTDAAYYAALRADSRDRQHLLFALEAASAASAGHDPVAQARADAAFHMAVAQASHNAVLRQVVAGLSSLLMQSITHSLTNLYRLPDTVRTLDSQHRLIAEAICEGRADEARMAAADHLAFVEDSLHLLDAEAARSRRSAALRQEISRGE